jgi:hypothetical protein
MPIFCLSADKYQGFAVFDPVVVDAVQNLVERLGDAVEVFEGQLAVVELTV